MGSEWGIHSGSAKPTQLSPAVGLSWMPDLAALLLGCTYLTESAGKLRVGRPPGWLISMLTRLSAVCCSMRTTRCTPRRPSTRIGEPGRTVYRPIRASGISAH